MFAGCCTTEADGQFVFLTCAETGFEGIFSGQQAGSMTQASDDHWEAHREQNRRREAARARQNAWHIYRTTEPGNPARRGINAYLSY